MVSSCLCQCTGAEVLTDANVNLSVAYGAGYVFADAKFLEDGASLALAGYQIRMISTPGHTAEDAVII